MKAAFITMHGTLVAGHAARFVLRKGASDGLRRLAELDFRLIVIDHASAAARACVPAALKLMPAQCDPRGWLPHQQHDACPFPRPAPSPHPQRRRSDATADPGERGNREAGQRRSAEISQRRGAEASKRSSRDAGRRDRLIDLLLREQLPLHDYYGCAQGVSRGVPEPRTASARQSDVDDRAPGRGVAGSHQRDDHSGQHSDHHGDQRSDHRSDQHGDHHSGQHSGHSQEHGHGRDAASGAGWPGLRLTLPGDAAAAPARHRHGPSLPPQALLLQLLRAAVDHRIDLRGSWLLGADLDAIEAGHRAGCRTVLIDNGTETVWHLGRGRMPTRIAPDLHAAAALIIEEGQRIRMW